MASHVQDARQIWTVLSASNLPSFGWNGWSRPGSPLWRFLGVLVSALLLSLGAPFWYNALARLTNLRPFLASNQQSQDQAKLSKQSQPSK